MYCVEVIDIICTCIFLLEEHSLTGRQFPSQSAGFSSSGAIFPLRAATFPLLEETFPLRAAIFPLLEETLPLRAAAFPLLRAILLHSVLNRFFKKNTSNFVTILPFHSNLYSEHKL